MDYKESDKKIVKGFFWVMLGFIMSNLIYISTNIVLVKLLLPVEFGVLATAFISINLIRTIKDTGISVSIVRNKIIDEEILSSSFIFNFFINLIFVTVTLFAAPFIAGYFNNRGFFFYV